ncbi:alpha/beta fold hydrolase [Parahaliea sp. F7430]|uniref:Alpha/beta fold hydrolase n=1 Tax=Sediminihaliea albiluteola TaxID=2758564 RepID=A0A7W2YL94_9GAMM|nr:haloalkane dehalogenase [Sediminihaliea albiluteola]MBA6414168.1 alpha/beta fold hydrolase [Sediminihaliea albiluteola]
MTVVTRGPDVPAVLRTAEECFANLADFPFAPHYQQVSLAGGRQTLRMHYIDEGPREAPVLLLLHGEPSWSYLYRKLVPLFTAAGYRVVAPDLIGFGRSDKPTRSWDYSFSAHIQWLRELVLGLDLQRITLVCQDWGGPVSLGVLAQEPERFAAVVVANTMLHTAGPELAGRTTWAVHASGEQDSTVNRLLLDWARAGLRESHFVAGESLQHATVSHLPESVIAAYNAPFPSEWHKVGMRQFPLLIPLTASDPGAEINRATWAALENFERPFLTLFSDSDPTTAGWEALFRERVPGAKSQPHGQLQGAGHFWQEDCGTEAAEQILAWLRPFNPPS